MAGVTHSESMQTLQGVDVCRCLKGSYRSTLYSCLAQAAKAGPSSKSSLGIKDHLPFSTEAVFTEQLKATGSRKTRDVLSFRGLVSYFLKRKEKKWRGETLRLMGKRTGRKAALGKGGGSI